MAINNYLKNFIVCSTLLFIVSCASFYGQESAGEYIDDTAITTKARATIFNDPDLKSPTISVETMKGEVQLSGFVKK